MMLRWSKLYCLHWEGFILGEVTHIGYLNGKKNAVLLVMRTNFEARLEEKRSYSLSIGKDKTFK